MTDAPPPAGDPGNRDIKIFLVGLAVLFLLGCAGSIAMFAMCTYM